jgi:tRNA pseudouridine55 synthase
MGRVEDGILLVDKEEGETSADVVRKVKLAVDGQGIRKVGHAGTLDPFASGLLIVLLGQGTKLSPFLMPQAKAYRATILLGKETDTLDSTGETVHTSPVGDLDVSRVHETLRRFIGPISQVPPSYSAVKYKGKRAYELARRGLNVKLPQRTVTIYELGIVSFEPPEITLVVRCSSGTYIRSLARDVGKLLGIGGHAKYLRRLVSGSFHVRDAVPSSHLSGNGCKEVLERNCIPLRRVLSVMPEIRVTERVARKVRNGHQPSEEELASGGEVPCSDGDHAQLVADSGLVAIVQREDGNRRDYVGFKVIRVFL